MGRLFSRLFQSLRQRLSIQGTNNQESVYENRLSQLIWQRWHSLTDFKKRLVVNTFIGFIVAVMVASMHHAGIERVTTAEDAAMDWMMGLQRGDVPLSNAMSYAFIDIDNDTYRYWKEPFYTPRLDLLRLIKSAENALGKIIIIDIDLSKAGHDTGDDELLVEYLLNYPEESPPLIFVRTFQYSQTHPAHYNERISTIDGLERVIESSPNMFWASTLFNVDNDNIVRRWRLWEHSCKENRPSTILSVQLITAVIAQSSESSFDEVTGLIQDTQKFPQDGCSVDQYKDRGGSIDIIDAGDMHLTNDPDSIAQRIIYTVPWTYRPGESSASIRVDGGSSISLVLKRSALPLLRSEDIDVSWLSDRVVVIGSSYPESRDIHQTPLGAMPGAMILVNAIHSLIDYGVLQRPPIWVILIIELLLIAIMTTIFALFDSFLGKFISGVAVIGILVPVSFIFYKSGVWVDFAAPLIAVQLHDMAAGFKKQLELRG